MEGFGFGKLLLILLIIVLVFGTAKLPKIGEDLGKAVRGFKKGMHDGDEAGPGNSDGSKGDKH